MKKSPVKPSKFFLRNEEKNDCHKLMSLIAFPVLIILSPSTCCENVQTVCNRNIPWIGCCQTQLQQLGSVTQMSWYSQTSHGHWWPRFLDESNSICVSRRGPGPPRCNHDGMIMNYCPRNQTRLPSSSLLACHRVGVCGMDVRGQDLLQGFPIRNPGTRQQN